MNNYLDASDLFGKHGSVVFNGDTVQLIEENSQKNDPMGPVHHITGHWSAGNYLQSFSSYSSMICYSAKNKQAFVVKNLKSNQKPQHTWSRNSSNYGISFAAMAEGCPVHQEQIDLMAIVIGEVCAWRQLDPRGHITLPAYTCDAGANNIWATGGTVTVPVIWHHKGFAGIDNYSAWRIDIGDLYPQVLSKAQGHYDALKSGKAEFQFKALFQD